jgi:predicted dehydrogenase
MPGNFAMQLESLAQSVLNDTEPEVSGMEGMKALQVLLAAYESFETKKIVSIEPLTL